MNKEVHLNEIIDIIQEKIEHGGTVTFTPNGKSMLPMLRDGEDVVVLSKKPEVLHLFDVVLYKRQDGSFVLHRIVGFDSSVDYVMCGDNQFVREHGINYDSVIAIVTAFFHKGKPYKINSFKYKIYANWIYYTRFFRQSYSCFKTGTRKILKKVKNQDNNEKDTYKK